MTLEMRKKLKECRNDPDKRMFSGSTSSDPRVIVFEKSHELHLFVSEMSDSMFALTLTIKTNQLSLVYNRRWNNNSC
jgi:hypothetical protein